VTAAGLSLDLSPRSRADDLVDDLAALEDEQRGDRANVVALSDGGVFVDVQLPDHGLAAIRDRELVDDGADDAAGTAPRGPYT
jgi:hypothetical protein